MLSLPTFVHGNNKNILSAIGVSIMPLSRKCVRRYDLLSASLYSARSTQNEPCSYTGDFAFKRLYLTPVFYVCQWPNEYVALCEKNNAAVVFRARKF